jgi:hypothetical protein
MRYSSHVPTTDNVPFVILHLIFSPLSFLSTSSHFLIPFSIPLYLVFISSLSLFYLFLRTPDPRDPSVTKSMVSTYKHLSMLVTNIALNQVESNLKLADDQKGLEYLSHSVALMSEDFQPTDLRYVLNARDEEYLIPFSLYAAY